MFKGGTLGKSMQIPVEKKIGEVYSCPEVELEGEFFLGQLTEVDMVERSSKESWKAEVKLNEHAVKFKVDTGADVTVTPPNIYHSLVPKPFLSKCDKTLMGPCKHKLCCLGNFTAKVCVNDKVITELIYVVKDLERPLLGRDAAEKLKLVIRVDTVSSDDYKTKMASKHRQLFTGLGQMKETYTITLKEDAKPFAISVPRKVPLPLYQKTKDELDRMLETDKVKAISDLPPLTNLQEVRMFLGMVNKLSKFSDHLADKTKSIRELLLKGNQWV